MQFKLAMWSTENKSKRFDRLFRLITHPEWLRAAAKKTLSSSGAKTPGVDGVTERDIRQDFELYLIELRSSLLSGSYKPLPVKRIYIPKSNGKLRPLGIPCLRDRIIQRAMLMAMEPIWESDFYKESYGFRPGRSVHHAINSVLICLTDISSRKRKGRWVIEGDLSSYFDTVHHKLLIRCVKRRIRDSRFTTLLWQMLKAGHVDKGVFQLCKTGVPQGGVISPLLSNIMLHELDSYMLKHYVGSKARNHRHGWNTSVKHQTPIAIREGRQIKALLSYVRYADDFVIVVKGTHEQAKIIREEIRCFLESQLALSLNMDKTHITHVNDGFVFLGHRIIRKRSGRGHMRPVSGIPRECYRRFSVELSSLLSGNHHLGKVEMLNRLNRKIMGWTQFYRHTMYTAMVYQKLDTVLFWKVSHWLARKYKSRIKKLMRKWYQRSKRRGVKTWVVHDTVNGETVSAALAKCIGSKKCRFMWKKSRENPYICNKDIPFHMSYTDIATITGT